MALTLSLGLLLMGAFLFSSSEAQIRLNQVDGPGAGLGAPGAGPGDLFNALNSLARCRQSTGVTDDEVRRMIETRQVPTSRAGQCLLACMGEAFGVMRNGVFSGEAAMQRVDTLFLGRLGRQQDPGLRTEIQRVIDTCASRGSASQDACENAAALAACGMEESATLRAMHGQRSFSR